MNCEWHQGWRICQITGTVSVPARPGIVKPGRGHSVEVAHLVPRRVLRANGENDSPYNTLYLRADVHCLLDGAMITIGETGRVICDQHLPFTTIRDLHDKQVGGYTRANDAYGSRHRRWVYDHGFEPWVP